MFFKSLVVIQSQPADEEDLRLRIKLEISSGFMSNGESSRGELKGEGETAVLLAGLNVDAK